LFKGIAQRENSVKVCYPIEERIAKCGKPFVDRESVNNVFSACLILLPSSETVSNVTILKDTVVW
jgi:hypothetical protein